jgi:hypothetical protein
MLNTSQGPTKPSSSTPSKRTLPMLEPTDEPPL